MNLYAIQNELTAVLTAIEAQGGEVTPEVEALLTALQLSKEQKLSNCCAAIKNWEAEVEALKREVERMKERQRIVEHRIESFKKYMLSVLGEEAKWTNGVHRLSIRDSVRVIISPDVDIPKQYVRVEVKEEIDKRLIKTDLESGATLPFAHLETFHHLQVK